jgi:hypothetical protein
MRLNLFRRHAHRCAVLDGRAIAVFEFAITAPLVVLFLATASDYGLREWSRSCLANAVAQGAYYAFRTGTTVTQANVQTLVKNVSSLTGVGVTTTNPTLCYCPSGSTTAAATMGSAVACTSTCSITVCTTSSSCTTTTGIPPGNYMHITGTYTLTGIFPASIIFPLPTKGTQISESMWVRLQ